MFWTGAALIVASINRRAELLALTAAAVWLGVVVLLPAAGSTISSAVEPTPSAFELINRARAAEVRANRKLMENLEGYVSDHPELQAADLNEDDWSAKLYATHQVIERAVAPEVAAQDALLERQSAWLAGARFLSPTAAVDHLMSDASGTGAARQRDYVRQVRSFLLDWRNELTPMIFRRERLAAEDIGDLPRFTFNEPPVPLLSSLASLAYLAVAAAIALTLGTRRTRRA